MSASNELDLNVGQIYLIRHNQVWVKAELTAIHDGHSTRDRNTGRVLFRRNEHYTFRKLNTDREVIIRSKVKIRMYRPILSEVSS